MGLLTTIKKLKQKERFLRLLILGLDNAGKTTILARINNDDIHAVFPTLGFNIKTIEHLGFKLNFWDVGGQKSIRSYWRNYFEATDGLVWVVDANDKDRLDMCRRELKDLLKEERLAGASLLVFANKQDIEGALPVEQIIEKLDLDSIKSHNFHVEPCSAYSGENLLHGIDWIVADIETRLFMRI